MLFCITQLLLLTFTVVATESSTLDLTDSSTCTLCSCGPGPSSQPKEHVKCVNISRPIRVISLPSFVRVLSIHGCKESVTLRRGAIRVRQPGFQFKLSIISSPHVIMEEKCATIVHADGSVLFSTQNVARISIKGRAISAQHGHFVLDLKRSVSVKIDGQAFDVMDVINIDQVGTLDLAPAAFKPNVPLLQQPTTKIHLSNINSISYLPMDVFSSALSIKLHHCNIGEVESFAFTGFSVNSVEFKASSVDRIHTAAFPDKSVINNLTFDNCTITSVSEKAVASGISTLRFYKSLVLSISTEAIHCHVANFNVEQNTFSTLVKNTFVLKQWSEILLKGNKFKFLEGGALNGIESDKSDSRGKNFTFVDNTIQYANRAGLALQFNEELDNLEMVVRGNVFLIKCRCDFNEWLLKVTNSEVLSDMLFNTSYCKVPEFATGECFANTSVLSTEYQRKMCSMLDAECSSVILTGESPWDIFREQIEVHSNKGILLLVLLFALASTLLVGIVTLLRWIVYTIQMRKYRPQKDEWCFTKIEEKTANEQEDIEMEESPSPTQHYESLPLTTTETLAPSQPNSPNLNKTEEVVESVEKGEEEEEKLLAKEAKPQKTFYDEMICLLKEKLDDPDNYATVADGKNTTTHNVNTELYQDPAETAKK